MQVRLLGQKDPPEKQMATQSYILAWRIHGQRSLAGSTWDHKRIGHDLVTEQQVLST